MATEQQIEEADTARRKSAGKDRSTRGGSNFTDPSIVPASLEACKIPEWQRASMRERIIGAARTMEERDYLLAVILDESYTDD
jgi:hypothetical protein